MGDRRTDAEPLSDKKRDWPLVVRRARPDDRDAVLEFATNTWDGWDYIPHAWPVWIEATDGMMLVATRPDDDTPIALTRIAMVSPTEAWWEGIRVNPELRGLEIATDLQVAELQWSAALGATAVRYATGAHNEGSHRLGAKHGVELLLVYRNYWWSAQAGDPRDPSGFDATVRAAATQLRGRVLDALADEGRVASAADADRLWAVVDGDAEFNAALRLYEPRPWALGELTDARVRRHIDRGEVINFDDRGIAILLREQAGGEDSSLRLALVLGDIEGMLELLERIVTLARERTVRFRLLESATLEKAGHDRLIGSGFQSGDGSLHILGRPIDAEHPIPDVDPARLVLADEPRPIVRPPT